MEIANDATFIYIDMTKRYMNNWPKNEINDIKIMSSINSGWDAENYKVWNS